ncbi:MAG TPA: hypothetical protein VLT13_03600 [Bacteroidota bacterium]|nr:hypothetical protein [Bacteroidota bacterium]
MQTLLIQTLLIQAPFKQTSFAQTPLRTVHAVHAGPNDKRKATEITPTNLLRPGC